MWIKIRSFDASVRVRCTQADSLCINRHGVACSWQSVPSLLPLSLDSIYIISLLDFYHQAVHHLPTAGMPTDVCVLLYCMQGTFLSSR